MIKSSIKRKIFSYGYELYLQICNNCFIGNLGIMIFFNASDFGQILESKEYYSAIIGSQIHMRLYNENVDTKQVLTNEVINTLFSFIRFKVDEKQKEILFRDYE